MKREIDYRLWREYLKRSDKYRKFCQLINEGCIPGIKARENRRLNSHDNQILLDVNLFKTWDFFRDVFNQEFEKWWPPKMPESLKSVVELEEAIKKPTLYTKMHMLHFRRKNGRNPSIDEFAQFGDPECVYLRIHMTEDVTADDVAKEIAEIKKNKRTLGLIRSNVAGLISSSNRNQYYRPTGRIHHQNLEDYLKIYDLKNNFKWNEVMKQHPLTHLSVKNEDRKRTYLLYKQKAIKIIKNVEEGYFPGQYD